MLEKANVKGMEASFSETSSFKVSANFGQLNFLQEVGPNSESGASIIDLSGSLKKTSFKRRSIEK